MSYDGLITENIYEPRLRYVNRKGIYPIIRDHNEIFRRLTTRPVIGNDLDLMTPEGKDLFNRLVYSRYEGDVFSNVPVCPCGALHDGDVCGDICGECGMPALPPTDQPIQPLIWVRAPKGTKGFMNPTVYGLFKKILMRNTLSVLDWLIDPKYRPPHRHSIHLELLNELIVNGQPIKRGMSYFIDNFDAIIEVLYETRRRITKPRTGAKETITLLTNEHYTDIKSFLDIYRDAIFSEYIPFPSKIAFVIEEVGKQTYVDGDMSPAINALISIVKSDQSSGNLDTLNSYNARAIRDLSLFYSEHDKHNGFGKEGVYRKLVYGFEPHFCLRAVITSIHKPHDHREIYLPWGGSILMMKLHIANKLLSDDYTPNEINTLIYDNILRKNPKLDRVLDELIAETPGGKGIPILNTRFPSLYHGSTQFFYGKIDRDPTNLSIQISISTVTAMTAD